MNTEVSINQTITFRTKHRYDHNDHTGTFVGMLHYEVAKKLFDIHLYYQNLDQTKIVNPTPTKNLTFVVIMDGDGKYFAAAEEWITDGSFKVVADTHIDIRVFGISNAEEQDALLQIIRAAGHSVQVM